ncbi:MAG: YbjN domain-containing protein [Hyphomicrobiales bacterium]
MSRVRNLSAALAAAMFSALFAAVPAGASAGGASRDDVADALERLGITGTYDTTDGGALAITTMLDDRETLFLLGDCDPASGVCRDIAISATFDAVAVLAPEKVLSANGFWPFLKVFTDPDTGLVSAELDQSLVSGDLDLRLKTLIAVWRDLAATMAASGPATTAPVPIGEETRRTAMAAALAAARALLDKGAAVPPDHRLALVTPDAVAAMFEAAGYPATLAGNGAGRTIAVTLGEVETTVATGLCSPAIGHCGALRFLANASRAGASNERLNWWNGAEWYVRVRPESGEGPDGSKGPDGGEGIVFDMEVPVFDGLSPADLARYIDVWYGEVSYYPEFAAEIVTPGDGANPPPAD